MTEIPQSDRSADPTADSATGPVPAGEAGELPEFVFVVCQRGAESAAKEEILGQYPDLRSAFSRPGFLTFKVPPGTFPLNFHLRSTLARTSGWCLGSCRGDCAEDLVDQVAGVAGFADADRIHVFQRDAAIPGHQGFEPGITPLAAEIGMRLEQRWRDVRAAENRPVNPEDRSIINQPARAGQRVFDVILVEPDQWWYGFHLADSIPQRWPGGVPLMDTRQEVYSRAYFKLAEALLWSGIKIGPGDKCVELGSAPGGACQRILEMGAEVIAVDPAEMEPALLEDARLTHLRRRSFEVRKRDLRNVQWLFTDINTDPDFSLDAVAEIVGHEATHIKGMLLTLKLSDWSKVAAIPDMLKRVHEMGFQIVKSRQLAFNRREFCLAAIKNKFVLRSRRQRTRKKPGKQRPA